MLAKLKLDFLNILSLALWPQSHFCRLALVMAARALSHSRGKTHNPASHPMPASTQPQLCITARPEDKQDKLPRTVSTIRIILFLCGAKPQPVCTVRKDQPGPLPPLPIAAPRIAAPGRFSPCWITYT